jgi:hypothetical protein
MTEQQDYRQIAWWAENIEELDREIARLCLLCQVRILDPGVIKRVLKKDASVCGTLNPMAFAKLHNMLMFYFAIREKAIDAIGELQTEQIENLVVEQLRNRFADLLGKWPPA